MVNPISGNLSISEDQRLDINPEAATPAYLENNQEIYKAEPQAAGIDSSQSSFKDRAVRDLRNPRIISLFEYIPNLPDWVGDTQNCVGPPVNTGGAGGAGGTGAAGGAGSTSDIESDAADAAEELLDEAQKLMDELKEGDWVIEHESGYEYIDPEFFVKYEELMAILNALQILGMIIDAIRDLKMNALKMMGPEMAEDTGKGSAGEVLSSARESGMLFSQGQFMELTEEVWSHNQFVLKQKQGQAEARAEEEANGNVGNWILDIFSSGGAGCVDREKDLLYLEKLEEIGAEYAQFNQMVQTQYEQVLGDSSLYQDGLTDINTIFSQLTWDNLAVNISDSQNSGDPGEGIKFDVDRDKLLAYQMQLSSQQNYRRIYFMLHEAQNALKKMVAEAGTGLKLSTNAKAILNGVLESLETFEGMVFSSLTYQLQATIASSNSLVDIENQLIEAEYLYASSVFAGFFGPLGGLVRNISDWVALEVINDIINDDTIPTQLDANRVYTILADLTGMSVEELRDGLSEDASSYAKTMERLNNLEWYIIGQLSYDNSVGTGDDGYPNLREMQVNALREKLVRVQNAQLLLAMLVEGLSRLKKIVGKVVTGLGDIASSKALSASIKSASACRLQAFDLKLEGIKNRVQEEKIQKQQKERLEKAREAAVLSLLLTGVAVVIIIIGVIAGIFTGGAGFVAAIGFVAAMGQLGVALGNIFYNLSHPVDDRIHENTTFYNNVREESEDDIERMYNNQIDSIDEHSHIDIEENSDFMAPDNMWGMDTKLFMNVRNKLVKIYIAEQIILLYMKAQQDLKSIVVSSATGAWTGSDFSEARMASKSRFQQKIRAYQLKDSMVKEILSRHNLRTAQVSETNWAILDACISAVSIVTFGLAQGAGEALKEAMDVAQFSLRLASLAFQTAHNIIDISSGYGELEEFSRIQATIDQLVDSAFDQESRNIIATALADVHEDNMLESIGIGKVTVDSALYYQGMRSIQQCYNRLIILSRLKEALGRIKARAAGAPSYAGAGDALEAEKANYIAQLGLLQERVETYAERFNAMVEAQRQLAITLCMVVYTIVMKALNEKGVINKLKSKLNQALKTDQVEVNMAKNANRASLASALLTGQEQPWSGTIGLSDLVNIVIDFVLSPQTMKAIAKKIADKSQEKKGPHAKEVNQVDESQYDSQVDIMAARAYNNQLKMADLQIEMAKLGIKWQDQQAVRQFILDAIDSSIDSWMDDSYLHGGKKAPLDVVRGQMEEALGVSIPTDVPLDVMEDLSLKAYALAKINWTNPSSVISGLENFNQEVTSTLAPESAALSIEVQASLANAACLVGAEDIMSNLSPEKVETAVANLEAVVRDPEVDPKSKRYAVSLLGHVARQQSEGQKVNIEKIISEVYHKEVSSAMEKVVSGDIKPGEAFALAQQNADEILALIEIDRPADVLMGRINAQMILAVPQLEQAVRASLESIDWVNDTPQEISSKLQAIVAKVTSASETSDQAAMPNQQAMMHAAAAMAAQMVVADPELRAAATRQLETIKESSSNSELIRYADLILNRIAAGSGAQSLSSQVSESGDQLSVPPQTLKLISQLYARSQVVGGILDRLASESDPGKRAQHLEALTQQLDLMKADILTLVRLDARMVGIDLQGAEDAQNQFAELVGRISSYSFDAKNLSLDALSDLSAILQTIGGNLGEVFPGNSFQNKTLAAYLTQAAEVLGSINPSHLAAKQKAATSTQTAQAEIAEVQAEIESNWEAMVASVRAAAGHSASSFEEASPEKIERLKRKHKGLSLFSDSQDSVADEEEKVAALLDLGGGDTQSDARDNGDRSSLKPSEAVNPNWGEFQESVISGHNHGKLA